MGDDLNRQLSDALADGRMTLDDASSVQAFAQFLTETPKGVAPGLRGQTAADVVECFPSKDAFEAWRSRWLPFVAGLALGPTTPEEFAELLPEMTKEFPS